MARQGKGILDGFSGSVSKVTGYKSKGKSIVKSKSKESEKTQTSKLIDAKNSFAYMKQLYSTMLDLWWADNLQRKTKKLSVMNQMLKHRGIFDEKTFLWDPDFNLFLNESSAQKWSYIIEEVLGATWLKITQHNIPLPPGAMTTDDIFYFHWYSPGTFKAFTFKGWVFRSHLASRTWGFGHPISSGDTMILLVAVFSANNLKPWNCALLRYTKP